MFLSVPEVSGGFFKFMENHDFESRMGPKIDSLLQTHGPVTTGPTHLHSASPLVGFYQLQTCPDRQLDQVNMHWFREAADWLPNSSGACGQAECCAHNIILFIMMESDLMMYDGLLWITIQVTKNLLSYDFSFYLLNNFLAVCLNFWIY